MIKIIYFDEKVLVRRDRDKNIEAKCTESLPILMRKNYWLGER